MKTLFKIAFVLFALMAMASCEKDEFTGKLEGTIERNPNSYIYNVVVYTESGNGIFSKSNPKGTFSVRLNVGNYIIATYPNEKTFQIRDGPTTKDYIDNDKNITIKY